MKIRANRLHRFRRIAILLPLFGTVLFFTLIPLHGYAQIEPVHVSIPAASLPETPRPSQEQQGTTQAAGVATITGTILDPDGATVAGAKVILRASAGSQMETQISDASGSFTFAQVQAGSYTIAVESSGFASYETQAFTVAPQQIYSVPAISLAIAGASTNVVVRPTEEVAAEQIKAEEKQRALAIIPNFYVSYEQDPAPLTSKQKLSLTVRDTFDWTTFIGVSMSAGILQAANSFSGYGQGAQGYAKRWGAVYVDGRTSDFFSHYVFASLFHQDPRYFYQGVGSKKSRLLHAVSNGFVARSDSGKTMPNYAYLTGDLFSAALSNAYYPESSRGAGLVFTNAGLGIAGRAAQAVIQEFIARRFTTNTHPANVP